MTGPTKSAFTGSLREAIVVVFSILLAFALDSWWDGFQEGRQASTLAEAVVEELRANQTSLAASVERHRAIADAITEALRTGSTEAVHGTAVIAREIWEPRTAALETLLSIQANSDLFESALRVQLGTVLEDWEEYRERELRAAGFRDRARERLAESGLPIYEIVESRPVPSTQVEASRHIYGDQILLNYLTLRYAEEVGALDAAEALSASIRSATESLNVSSAGRRTRP
jgi:hypothetical protein